MLFSMLLGPVTARASVSVFYPSTLCALQIVFMIMIINRKPVTMTLSDLGRTRGTFLADLHMYAHVI